MLQTRNAAPAEGGAHNVRRLSNDDTAPISIGATDVKIELLLDDIGANVGVIECQLNCLAAMVQARDSAGVVYALKRLKAHWRCLALDARDLIAADAERLSAIRQSMEVSQ